MAASTCEGVIMSLEQHQHGQLCDLQQTSTSKGKPGSARGAASSMALLCLVDVMGDKMCNGVESTSSNSNWYKGWTMESRQERREVKTAGDILLV